MQIHAAVLRAPDAPHVLEPVELPEPRPGEVRVRIVAAGFCHTDGMPRTPEHGVPLPLILGHEGAGVVEAVGAGVPGLSAGDHVVLSFDSCGVCANCRTGHPAGCDALVARNLTGRNPDGSTSVRDADGDPVGSRWFGQSSFATHALATARNAVRVEKSLPLELLAPLGCSVQAGAGAVLRALRVPAGASVLITGTGAVGLSAVLAARVAGAATVIAVDLHAARLDLAREFGATHALDGADGNLAEQIQKITGRGAAYALDTTGEPSVISTGLDSMAGGGVMALIGAQRGELPVGSLLMERMLTLRGAPAGDAVPQQLIPQLTELWQQGRFPFDRMISTFPLSELDAAERAAAAGEVVKPVLLPGEPGAGSGGPAPGTES